MDTMLSHFNESDLKQLISDLKVQNINRIVLQFSNELLHLSPDLQKYIEQSIDGSKIFILCDPLKQSCCLDTVGSNHIKQYQCVVHVGMACFTEKNQSNKIRTFYLLNKVKFHPDCSAINQYINSNIDRQIDIFIAQKLDFTAIRQHIQLQNGRIYDDYKELLDQKKSELEKDLILIENKDSLLVRNIIYNSMHYNYQNIQLLDIEDTSQLQSQNELRNDLIFRRFNQIEKVKKLQTFAILYSNVNNRDQVLIGEYCRKLLKHLDKKCYKIIINSLNEAKLNNFMEIDVYVFIGCNVNSIIDCKTYYKDIISVYELLLVLEQIQWNSAIVTDYQQLKDIIENQIEDRLVVTQDQNKQQIQQIQNQIQNIDLDKRQVQAFQERLFQNLEGFQARKYQGLDKDQEVGVGELEQGLDGIAGVYKNEIKQE